MKTARQIDGEVSFTAGQFAQCPALNEPPELLEFTLYRKVLHSRKGLLYRFHLK